MEVGILIAIIVMAILFDFINGFHDAANSIATVVTTKVLTPTQGVLWAAFFNFVAFFIAKFIIGEFGIADTVSKVVEAEYVRSQGLSVLPIVLSGLIAAIIWNLLTWLLGIPSSSSHTLIGGLAGAAISAAGFQSVHGAIILKIVVFIFAAPVIGMLGGLLITSITLHAARHSKPHKADVWFKRLQLVSSAMLSIGHGLNDSQKEIGIIATALIAVNSIPGLNLPPFLQLDDIHNIQDWVPLCCFTAIAIGTMSGGWKIMKTMGNRITKITPVEGFCAQTAGAFTLFFTELLKIPVSTTHVISGSIMGVGATKRLSAVHWGVSISLLWAWVLTIPVSGTIGFIVYKLVSLIVL